MSFDNPSKNQSWAEDQGYEFELWSDDDKTLAITYGAAANDSAYYADRITVVLNEEGNLILEYLENISVGTHPAEVLDDLQKVYGD